MNGVLRRDRNPISVPVAIFFCVMALLTIGVICVYSSSASLAGFERRHALERRDVDLASDFAFHGTAYLKRQIMWACVSLGVLFFFYRFDYRRLKRWSFWIMAASFVTCLLVWAPVIGVESNGSRRWLNLGIGRFQPSEFARLGLIIYMAKMMDDRRKFIRSFFSGVVPALIVTGAFALAIVLEPDFGAAFVLCCIIFGMWICGEMRWFHLTGLIAAGIPAAVMAFITQPYRIRRLFAFLNPDDPEVRMGAGFQLYQSLIAVGSGGPWGQGLGMSMQKNHYLFAAHTDFIFAIMAEELGFVRTSVVLIFFATLVMLGWWVALNTSDLFGSFLATGITLMLFLGVTLNISVVIGLMPTKGLVLPFISYGGSSLLATMASMGILMNIARRQFLLSGAGRTAAAPIAEQWRV